MKITVQHFYKTEDEKQKEEMFLRKIAKIICIGESNSLITYRYQSQTKENCGEELY